MRRLSLVVTLCLAGAFVGCDCGSESEDPIVWFVDGGAGGPSETNCVNDLDDDGDGKIDCLDNDCNTDRNCDGRQPTLCRTQADCGDRVADVAAPVCLEGKCVAPGQFDPETGEALVTDVNFNIIFDKTYAMSAQHPETVVVRFLHPNKLDGSPLNCTEVKTLNGSTEATRSLLDQNQNVNLVYRTIFKVSWGASSPGDYVLPTVPAPFVPKGKDYIMYAEAWYGPRAQNNPTGNRASMACLEGIDLTVADPKVNFAFRP